MKLVIDTNRIMAGLLRDSTSRKIILQDSFSFYAPDYIETELFKHRVYLVKKTKLSEPDFDILMYILLEHVILVPFEDFGQEYDHAMQIMKTVDENDSLVSCCWPCPWHPGYMDRGPAFSQTGSSESLFNP
jgi:predicted nucleic acid-binding protein